MRSSTWTTRWRRSGRRGGTHSEYVRVEVLPGSPHARAIVRAPRVEAVTSADERGMPLAPSALTERQQRIHELPRCTLRNCMPTAVEDGPKRDRWLWLGDLRLRAELRDVSELRACAAMSPPARGHRDRPRSARDLSGRANGAGAGSQQYP
ncbi:MAG: hypothetical protein N2652_06165 [Kiritimatiellae bacterium]|nr:hypothetical protein [Kiritimatiellia bacterium]